MNAACCSKVNAKSSFVSLSDLLEDLARDQYPSPTLPIVASIIVQAGLVLNSSRAF